MRRAIIVTALLLFVAGCNTTEPETEVAKQPTFDSIDAQFEQSFESALSRTEKTKIVEQFANDMLDFARSNPDGDDSIAAYEWVARKMAGSSLGLEALEILIDRDPNQKKLIEIAGAAARSYPSRKTKDLLLKLIENSELPEVKGITAINYVKFYETVDRFKSLVDVDSIAEKLTADDIEFVKEEFKPELREQLIELLDETIAKYGDVEYGANGPVSKEANELLFKLSNLWPGAPAMEIEAEDLDGVSFKLSDYRGKVVLLDFWGDW